MCERTLYDAAKVLRSKNSGPFAVTLDVLFDDEALYRQVKDKDLLNRQRVAALYGLDPADVSEAVYFDNALGVKITLTRPVPSGSPLDTDVYGAQQHAPLMGVVV